MSLSEWLALGGVILGSGVGAGLLRYAVRHEKKHQQIDDELDLGGKRFDRNEADHEAILGQVAALSGKVDRVGAAVREVLVAVGARRPGAGINGNGKAGEG